MSTRKVAAVTGATGGIGAAICRTLSRDGYHIVAQYHSNVKGASALSETIRRDGGECSLVRADLAEIQGVEQVIAHTMRLLRENPLYRLRALVNNAGLLLGPSFADATPDQFDEYFSINTRAPFFLAQRLTREMPAGGSVVNISSSSAHFSSPGDIIYAMSKSALESLTKNMAEAIAAQGLRVNSIVPGFTDNGHPAFRNEQARQYMSSFAVLGGVADPQTIADAVSFLVSDKASRTTGATIDVSGGSTLSSRGHRAGTVRDLL